MKKILLYMGVALASIGCTKDADITAPSGDNALTFTSNIATRAEKSQWVDTDAIGVYMTSTDFGDGGANRDYTYAGSDSFTSTDPLYLPSSGSVEIFAYYPYKDFDNENDFSLTAYSINSEEQVDLLKATDDNVSSSNVSLTFNHVLSKISLAIEAGNGVTMAYLDELDVKISGISTEGTFNLNSNEATTTNSDSSLGLNTIITKESDEVKTITSSAIIIPQTLDGATLYFTTKNGESDTFITTLPTKEFKVGQEYSYTITIKANGVELSESSINPWGTGDTTSGTASIVDIEYKTSDGKYHINSAKGLAAFRDLVNGASNTQVATCAGFENDTENGGTGGVAFGTSYLEIDGVLTRNIDLSTVCGADLNDNAGANWTPIGFYNNDSSPKMQQYKGTFDGDGYIIKWLYINSSALQQSLFRYLDADGKIINLGVSGKTTCTNAEGTEIGGIVALNNGSIMNCYSEVEVIGSNVTNVGGITGYNSSTSKVVNCYNLCDIEGKINIGGIVGYNQGYVGYCYNTGAVSTSTGFENGYSMGDNIFIKFGGVVGYNSSTLTESVKGSFCLNTTEYSIGQTAETAADGALHTNVCYPNYFTSETFATTMNNGAATYNSNYEPTPIACAWIYNADGYPTHDFGETPEYKDLDIIYNSVDYTINTTLGLQAFAALVNGTAEPDGVITSGDDVFFEFGSTHASISGKLNNNIVLDPDTWTPIGTQEDPYSGTFDINNKSITGITIDPDDGYKDLFGYTDNATINNFN